MAENDNPERVFTDINDFWAWAKTRAGHKHEPRERLLMLAALGLTGEAGEFADLIKKQVFHEHPLDAQKALSELGDVLWYIGLAADTLGFTLEDVAMANRAKLLKRYPNGFRPEDSLNRKDDAPTPAANSIPDNVGLGKWWICSDRGGEGRWSGPFDSREAAMTAAAGEFDLKPGATFLVGMAVMPSLPKLDVDDVLERLDDSAGDLGRPDHVDCWPDPTDAQRAELDASLNAALDAWLAKHKLGPTWFDLDQDTVETVPEPEAGHG